MFYILDAVSTLSYSDGHLILLCVTHTHVSLSTTRYSDVCLDQLWRLPTPFHVCRNCNLYKCL